MKSTNNTVNRSEAADINYKPVFSGEVYATPVVFNPTAAQLREMKNIPAEYDIDEPEYVRTIQDNEYRMIELHCKFNPNKVLKLKNRQYPDEVFVKYKLQISDRPVVGSSSGKTQIIDEHNQSGWIELKGKKSIEKQVLEVQENKSERSYSDGDPIRRMDASTCRIACQGEVALYDLVFKMSTLDKHRINAEDDTKSTRLTEFKLGENPTETFKNLVNGELTALNMLLASNDQDFEGKEFFVKDGENNKIGLMLGATVSQDNDKIYQDVLAPFTVFPVTYEAVFRPTDRVNDYTTTMFNDTLLGKSRLNKQAVDVLTHEQYPWKAFWNNSFKFQEVTLDSVNKNEDAAEDAEDNSNFTDDLPF